MRRLNLLSILVSVAVLVPLVMVPSAGAQGGYPDKPKVTLVSHGSCAWDAFWCAAERGAKDAARDLNVDLTIIAPDKFNPEKTAQDIDKALAGKPEGLGVTVTDGVLFQEPMMRAIKSGIPVIAYNAADWRPKAERIPYITYIGQDEYLGGYLAGQKLLAADPDGKRAVCVNPAVGHVGTDTRCKGWNDALAEKGIKSEVLAITYDPAEAATTMEDYYTANPDVNLWLVQGTGGQDPFYTFLKNAGLKPGDIYQAGFDVSPKVIQHIKDGTTDFTIDQVPYLQGYMAVQWLSWILRYGMYPPSDMTLTGPNFIDKTNADKVEEWAGKTR